MIRIKMVQTEMDPCTLVSLGNETGHFLTKNTGKYRVIHGKGCVEYGPNKRSIKVRVNFDREMSYNTHEITIRDSTEEARLANEIRALYRQHNFSELQ